MGLYFDSLKNMEKAQKNKKEKDILKKKIDDLKKSVIETFSKELSQRGCIGSIAEIYDSNKPFLPKGTISQAWSVAQILKIVI